MQDLTALEAKNRFGELIEMAQRAPVTITRHGRASVVVMSAMQYERQRQSARKRLRAALDRTRSRAAASGLTEVELDAMLANDG